MARKVNIKGIKNKRHIVGICYVVIPTDVDRSTYIKNCFRNGVVSVQFEFGGGNANDIPVDLGILQNIDFPEESGKLGSCLVTVNEYMHNQPIIIGRLLKKDEITSLSENEFKLEKYTKDGSVSISGKADKGNLFLNVTSRVPNGGKVYIDVINPDKEGGIYLNLQGTLQAEIQKVVMNVLKDFNITSKEDINIDSNTVVNIGVKDNVQASLKGDDTVEQLKKELKAMTDLLQSIASITPSPVTSGAPDPTWLAWQSAVSLITDRGNYSSLQSEKVFLE